MYKIEALDPRTYLITDTNSIHMLMVNAAYGPNVNAQIIIAEVNNSTESNDYAEFLKEVLSFKMFAADWSYVLPIVSQILNSLEDVCNPVECAAMFGGELHGVTLQWPEPNLLEMH